MRNKIAMRILDSWGYHNVTVGDLDGRNYAEKLREYREAKPNRRYWDKDRSYKTEQAVRHAYRLADIAILTFKESV